MLVVLLVDYLFITVNTNTLVKDPTVSRLHFSLDCEYLESPKHSKEHNVVDFVYKRNSYSDYCNKHRYRLGLQVDKSKSISLNYNLV